MLGLRGHWCHPGSRCDLGDRESSVGLIRSEIKVLFDLTVFLSPSQFVTKLYLLLSGTCCLGGLREL